MGDDGRPRVEVPAHKQPAKQKVAKPRNGDDRGAIDQGFTLRCVGKAEDQCLQEDSGKEPPACNAYQGANGEAAINDFLRDGTTDPAPDERRKLDVRGNWRDEKTKRTGRREQAAIDDHGLYRSVQSKPATTLRAAAMPLAENGGLFFNDILNSC